jgi:hypothetical protein
MIDASQRMLTIDSQGGREEGGGEKVSFEPSYFIDDRLVFGTAACVVAVVVVKITAGRGSNPTEQASQDTWNRIPEIIKAEYYKTTD